MTGFPLVTVIIPVYNGAKYIKETLQSVFNQSYSPFEVIVVDDGSTDASAEIVQTFPQVQYIYQTNQGVSVARNTAIDAANGEYIALLDADDLWKREKLKIQINYMLKNPESRITATHVECFLQPDTQLPSWFNEGDPGWKVVEHATPSAMVIHHSVFREVGKFSPDFRASEDTEWIWRAKDSGIHVDLLPDRLALRRLHGANLSWVMKTNQQSRMLRILRESVKRKSGKS